MTYRVEEPERELSEYEKKRLERIRKNEEHLKKLGLDKFKDTMMKKRKSSDTHTSSKSKKNKKAKVTSKSRPKTRTSSRKSGRLARSSSASDTLVMLDYNQSDGIERVRTQKADEADSVEETVVVSYRTRRPPRRYNIDEENWKLSKDEKKVLEKGITDNYLSKFREFLQYHNMISEQNLRNVMRQVRKLAFGDGVRYESPRYGWPEDCYFKRGEKIGPLSDIVQLMEEAQECEDKWGRDHGNGWLLSHPLKKLLLFQQFALKNPSFLNAECKLKEYVKNENENENDNEEDQDQMATLPKEDAKSLSTKKGNIKNKDKNEKDQDKDQMATLPKEDAKSLSTKKENIKNENDNQDQMVSTRHPKEDTQSLSTDMIRDLKKADSKRLIGIKVAKKFGRKKYFGTIDKYDSKGMFWHVVYDDGDEEEIDRGDLLEANYIDDKICL